MKQFRAAVWGAGTIAQTHAEILKEQGIVIEWVVDANIERAKEFAERFGVSHYSNNGEDILNSEVDVVHVCTPPNLHYKMVRELLGKNYHVFCEKPMCFSNAEAAELYKIAEEKGLIHGVDFNVRYHKGVQEARRRVQNGDLGALRLIHGSYLQEFNAFPAPLDWRYNEALAGKMRAVTEIGSHWADLIGYITEEKITSVSAVFSGFRPQRVLKDGMMYAPHQESGDPIIVSSEDAAVVNFKTANGVLGNVVLCEASPGRINRLSFEITGEEQNIWWDSENNNTLHIGTKNHGSTTWVYPFNGGFRDTQRCLMQAFYKDVSSGIRSASCYPTFIDGATSVRICNAIYESATQGGKWITVEEEEE